MVEKAPRQEGQPEAPRKLTLVEKIAEAMTAIHEEHVVDEHPTSPSAVPGSRRKGRRHFGPVVNKTPHGYDY